MGVWQVSRTAKLMVTSMGMSKKMGQVAWSGGGGPSFLGSSMGQPPECSGETSDEIDTEVKQLVLRAYRYSLHWFSLLAMAIAEDGQRNACLLCRRILSKAEGAVC